MNTQTLPPQAVQLLNNTMPPALKRGIAIGAAPMPAHALVACLAILAAKDPDQDLRTKAATTLKQLPSDLIQTAFKGNYPSTIFLLLLKIRELTLAEREILVLNNQVGNDVITQLVKQESNTELLELIAQNQKRMLEHVELVEVLLENPSLGPASKSRIEEFFSRAFAGKVLLQAGIKTKEQLQEEEEWSEDLAEIITSGPHTQAEAAEVPTELLQLNDDRIELETAEDLIKASAPEPEEALEEENIRKKRQEQLNLRKALGDMTIAQRIKLALLGNKEARSLLIFDSNKVVSMLVLKNPRLTEQEAIAIAGSKSIRADILRGIAKNKTFMRSYMIKRALVNNPKTPSSLSLSLLTQLRDADLEKLMRSRQVSSALQQQAKRLMARKKH